MLAGRCQVEIERYTAFRINLPRFARISEYNYQRTSLVASNIGKHNLDVSKYRSQGELDDYYA